MHADIVADQQTGIQIKNKILGVSTVVKQITRLMYIDMVLLLNVMSVMCLVTNLNFVMYIIIVR
jgi:hypothetical protein